MNPNLGWLYYKGYYRNGRRYIDLSKNGDVNAAHFLEKNKQFLQRSFDWSEVKPLPQKHYSHFIRLRSTYPGLMSGTGYAHGTKMEGEFKIGFYFDHSTGLPVLPGSSVKGVLNAAFEETEYLREACKEVLQKEFSPEQIKGLKKEIFEGKGPDQKMFSPYDRDIFFDAQLSTKNEQGQNYLGNDSITPHEHPLKDPIPLLFLKVLPNVLFDFVFILKPSRAKNGTGVPLLSADDKRDLFEKILLDFGVGAKTNVGYGQLSRPKALQPPNKPDTRTRSLEEFRKVLDDVLRQKVKRTGEGADTTEPSYYSGRLVPGRTRVEAECLGEDPSSQGFKRMKLFIGEPGKEPIALLKFPASIAEGRRATVEIGELNKDGTVKTVKIYQWK